MNLELRTTSDGIILRVRARAGAKTNSIGGIHVGAIKISVTQVAEKGKANAAIRGLLSKQLRIAKSDIVLISGQSSSDKTFLISNSTIDKILQLSTSNESSS